MNSNGKLNKAVLLCCVAAAFCLSLLWLAKASSDNRLAAQTSEIELTVSVLVDGLSVPWDIAFTPDGTMLFNQRNGGIKARLSDGTVKTVGADFSDLRAVGEGGLMGMVVDPNFSSNRRFYTCQGHQNPQEIQVISWIINDDYDQATRVDDPLVGGIPMHSNGRHSGCRLRFGNDGYLYISTGDAATGATPQDLTSLAGKVLRVDASNGQGAPDNPYIDADSANSKLIYTYGHRNPQGLALRPGGGQMWVVEHGPDVDDEINLLQKGGNYGWNPLRTGSTNSNYYEGNPMTDTVKYPDAVEAKWSSGRSTYATAGGIFLEGDHWGDKEGWLAVATLKNSTLYLFDFSPAGAYRSLAIPSELKRTHNRLRSVVIGPDEALYITSSSAVLRVAPRQQVESSDETPPADPVPPPDTTPPAITIERTGNWLTAASSADDVDQSSWRNLRIAGPRCAQADFAGSFDQGPRADLSNLPAGDYIYCFAVRDQSNNWSYEVLEFEIAARAQTRAPTAPGGTLPETKPSDSGTARPGTPDPVGEDAAGPDSQPQVETGLPPPETEATDTTEEGSFPPETEAADTTEEENPSPETSSNSQPSAVQKPDIDPTENDGQVRRLPLIAGVLAMVLPIGLAAALLIRRRRTAKPNR